MIVTFGKVAVSHFFMVFINWIVCESKFKHKNVQFSYVCNPNTLTWNPTSIYSEDEIKDILSKPDFLNKIMLDPFFRLTLSSNEDFNIRELTIQLIKDGKRLDLSIYSNSQAKNVFIQCFLNFVGSVMKSFTRVIEANNLLTISDFPTSDNIVEKINTMIVNERELSVEYTFLKGIYGTCLFEDYAEAFQMWIVADIVWKAYCEFKGVETINISHPKLALLRSKKLVIDISKVKIIEQFNEYEKLFDFVKKNYNIPIWNQHEEMIKSIGDFICNEEDYNEFLDENPDFRFSVPNVICLKRNKSKMINVTDLIITIKDDFNKINELIEVKIKEFNANGSWESYSDIIKISKDMSIRNHRQIADIIYYQCKISYEWNQARKFHEDKAGISRRSNPYTHTTNLSIKNYSYAGSSWKSYYPYVQLAIDRYLGH